MKRGLAAEAIGARVAADLPPRCRVWVQPELAAALGLEPPADAATAPSPWAIAVVPIDRLVASGEVTLAADTPPAERLWGVTTASLSIEHRPRAPLPGAVRLERVYCPLGVLEVTRDGLVIVALAPSVSARDFQATAEPTLKISSRVDVMRSTFGPESR